MPRWTHRFEIKPGAWVFVPDETSREYGKKLKESLDAKWKVPAYYAHLRPGGHVGALKRHIRDHLFIRADIKEFFSQINLSRVTRILKAFMPYEQARNAAKESVVTLPHARGRYILPFGFVQSPIIASICLQQSALGRLLDALNGKGGVTVSVYMDDIIVSTSLGSDVANSTFENLHAAADRSGFSFNRDKLIGPSDQVTAFNVELAHGRVAVTKSKLEDFAYRIITADSEHVSDGILGYTETVSREQAEDLRQSLLHV